MAKNLVYLAVGALTLTACTSEDVIDDVKTSSKNVIKFENVVNKPSRADLTSDNLEHFNVFGFYTMPGNDQHAHQVFFNTEVNKQSGAWTYAGGERYWVPGAKYYFYAYSCDNKGISDAMSNGISYSLDMDGDKDASDRVLEIKNYVCDNVHQHDLVFATNNTGILGLEESNPNVALQFKHILSKIKAKFTTKFPTEYEIVISDLSVENICDKGNYDPVSKWHSVVKTDDAKALVLPTAADVEFMVKNTGETTPMAIATNPVYVIPNNTEVALKFTIDVYIGNDRTEKVMSKTLTGKFTPSWQEGFQYVYNVSIDGTTTKMDVIVFTTGVDEFGNETDVTEPTDFEVTNNLVDNE